MNEIYKGTSLTRKTHPHRIAVLMSEVPLHSGGTVPCRMAGWNPTGVQGLIEIKETHHR